jgi:hypothetical protein
MIDKTSTIIFLIGILLLIVSHVYMNKSNTCTSIIMSICVVVSILLMGGAWILREVRKNEGYKFPSDDYRYAINDCAYVGGGAVCASYPQIGPSLGWVN